MSPLRYPSDLSDDHPRWRGPERGYYDGTKRVAGRKRHIIVVDTGGGLVLAAEVHGADHVPDRQDGAGGYWPKVECWRGWSCSGPTAPTRAGSANGCGASWGGASRCRTTATGSYGAMGWRRSR